MRARNVLNRCCCEGAPPPTDGVACYTPCCIWDWFVAWGIGLTERYAGTPDFLNPVVYDPSTTWPMLGSPVRYQTIAGSSAPYIYYAPTSTLGGTDSKVGIFNITLAGGLSGSETRKGPSEIMGNGWLPQTLFCATRPFSLSVKPCLVLRYDEDAAPDEWIIYQTQPSVSLYGLKYLNFQYAEADAPVGDEITLDMTGYALWTTGSVTGSELARVSPDPLNDETVDSDLPDFPAGFKFHVVEMPAITYYFQGIRARPFCFTKERNDSLPPEKRLPTPWDWESTPAYISRSSHFHCFQDPSVVCDPVLGDIDGPYPTWGGLLESEMEHVSGGTTCVAGDCNCDCAVFGGDPDLTCLTCGCETVGGEPPSIIAAKLFQPYANNANMFAAVNISDPLDFTILYCGGGVSLIVFEQCGPVPVTLWIYWNLSQDPETIPSTVSVFMFADVDNQAPWGTVDETGILAEWTWENGFDDDFWGDDPGDCEYSEFGFTFTESDPANPYNHSGQQFSSATLTVNGSSHTDYGFPGRNITPRVSGIPFYVTTNTGPRQDDSIGTLRGGTVDIT